MIKILTRVYDFHLGGKRQVGGWGVGRGDVGMIKKKKISVVQKIKSHLYNS